MAPKIAANVLDDLIGELLEGKLTAKTFPDIAYLLLGKAEALHADGRKLISERFFSRDILHIYQLLTKLL